MTTTWRCPTCGNIFSTMIVLSKPPWCSGGKRRHRVVDMEQQ